MITWIILIVVLALLILYDIFALCYWGVKATISQVIYNNSKLHPIIAFALGLLCGHLFWSQ